MCKELKMLKEKYNVNRLELALEMEAADFEMGKLVGGLVENKRRVLGNRF